MQYHQRLFSDDIHMKSFGPCIDEVYKYFCGFGSYPIFYTPDIEMINDIDFIIEEKRQFTYHELLEQFNSEEHTFIIFETEK